MATLYLVGTPIGNLQDMTLRAIETLKSVDLIACEDTRHSLGLLNYFEIKKPLITCHKFNEKESVEKISKYLDEDKDVALITDAGMPAISDPGAILVNELKNKGYSVSVIPGPTALTSAIALSGLLNPVFTFLGFLPDKKKDKDALIVPYKNINTNLVIYSSPYDLNKNIDYLLKTLGDRYINIVKEITKIHEKAIRCKLSSAEIEEAKGEYVIIIEPNDQQKKEENSLSIKEQLMQKLDQGLDKKEAIKQVAKENNLPKDVVYKEALQLD